jgi:hypothetical protein
MRRSSYVTIRRPVSTPFVTSWNASTIAYAVQNDRRRSSLVWSTPRSTTALVTTAAAEAFV